jgi:hypothetical protein
MRYPGGLWEPCLDGLTFGFELVVEGAIAFGQCRFRTAEAKRTKSDIKLLEKIKKQGKQKKTTPGQKSRWDEWDTPLAEIREVAEKFVLVNCYDPEFASQQFQYSFFNK